VSSVVIAFGAVAVVALIETILSVRWNTRYFTTGLPIFVRRIESLKRVEDLSLDELQKSAATVAATPLLFRRLAPDAIAFRESFSGGSLHYTPIMRGLIRARESDPALYVLGLVNWSLLALVIVIVSLLGRAVIGIAPYLAGAIAVIYFIQAVRYGRVARAIRRYAAGQPTAGS
jgi:hypothetical protein